MAFATMKATVRILNRVGMDRGFGNDEGNRQIREGCGLGVMMNDEVGSCVVRTL